jgi:glutathione S-transferase
MVKLYVIPGSHPCAAVETALALKGIAYERTDFIPSVHRLQGRLLYGARTVPGLRLDDGEKLAGSRTILRRLDAMVPQPALYPAGDRLVDVERAEAWGDEVLQPLARRLAWVLFKRRPAAMESYSEGANLPVPTTLARPTLPLIARIAGHANGATDAAGRSDVAALPGHLDRVDAWIADGTLGGETPTAADLQIGSSIRLLLTFGDVAPLIAGRPAERLAAFLTAGAPTGSVPAGVLPAAWLPAAAQPAT